MLITRSQYTSIYLSIHDVTATMDSEPAAYELRAGPRGREPSARSRMPALTFFQPSLIPSMGMSRQCGERGVLRTAVQ